MAEQHTTAELETQRINDYLRSFKTPVSSDVSLEAYLLEKAALELRSARIRLEKSLDIIKQ